MSAQGSVIVAVPGVIAIWPCGCIAQVSHFTRCVYCTMHRTTHPLQSCVRH